MPDSIPASRCSSAMLAGLFGCLSAACSANPDARPADSQAAPEAEHATQVATEVSAPATTEAEVAQAPAWPRVIQCNFNRESGEHSR